MDKVWEVSRKHLFLKAHVIGPEVIHMPDHQRPCGILDTFLVGSELRLGLLQDSQPPRLAFGNDLGDHGMPIGRAELAGQLRQMRVLQDLLQELKGQVEQDPRENGVVRRQGTLGMPAL